MGIEYTKEAIDLAVATDSPAVCLATEWPLPGTSPELAYEYLQNSPHEILDYAEQRGVEVGIEFEPELLVECTDEVLALIDDIGRSALGINLDIGHAAVYGEDLKETIHRSAGHITDIHLEDIDYSGIVTLELYTYPDTPDEAAQQAYEELTIYR